MEKSKLIALLSSFSGYEWRSFLTFLSSPYFNRRDELAGLARLLRSKLQQSALPERAQLYEEWAPGAPYDERAFNHQLSELQQLAERFLAVRRFEAEGVLADYMLLRECVDRRLEKPYAHALRRARRQLQQFPERDEEYWLQRYLLDEVSERHFESRQVRRFDPALQAASDSLEAFFLTKKLKFLCAMIDRQKIITGAYDRRMVDELKQYLAGGDFRTVPAVDLYYRLLVLLTEAPADTHFNSFREALREHRSVFSPAEQRDLYYFAINYCIQQLRYGEKRYATLLMALYREGLEHGALLDGGRLSPWTFKNMVKLGLGLEQFDWVESFITRYAGQLPQKQQDDAFHFNLADLYYHRRDFSNAFEHLNKVEFSDIHYSLGAKVMLLKIYYETEAEEALLSLLSSFRLYLQRNRQLPRQIKAPYQNFIALLGQLQRDNVSRSTLLERIQDTKMLSERSWLMRQLQ